MQQPVLIISQGCLAGDVVNVECGMQSVELSGLNVGVKHLSVDSAPNSRIWCKSFTQYGRCSYVEKLPSAFAVSNATAVAQGARYERRRIKRSTLVDSCSYEDTGSAITISEPVASLSLSSASLTEMSFDMPGSDIVTP